jgi:hexosaminidase
LDDLTTYPHPRIDNFLRTFTMQNLIPLPALIKPDQRTYTLHSDTAIFVQPDREEIRLIGQFLADRLRSATGFELPVLPTEANSSTGGILLTINEAGTDLGEEGYELDVEPKAILLRASHPTGLFRGAQTIRQLLPPAIESQTQQSGPGKWTVSAFRTLPALVGAA